MSKTTEIGLTERDRLVLIQNRVRTIRSVLSTRKGDIVEVMLEDIEKLSALDQEEPQEDPAPSAP